MINNFFKVKTLRNFFLIFIFFFNFNIVKAEQFWSNIVDGPTSNEEAIKLLNGKNLDPIEGLWFSDGLGTLLIYKDKDKDFARVKNSVCHARPSDLAWQSCVLATALGTCKFDTKIDSKLKEHSCEQNHSNLTLKFEVDLECIFPWVGFCIQ